MSRIFSQRAACYMLILAFSLSGVTTQSYAAIIGTDQIATQTAAQIKRNEIRQLLERKDVTRQLEAMGVNPDAAKTRVDSLTGAELTQLHQGISTLPAGEGALGTIAIVLVILILLDVAGVTDIFPKI